MKNNEPGCFDQDENLLFYKKTTARPAILHLKVKFLLLIASNKMLTDVFYMYEE